MLEDKNPQKTSLAELGEFGLINHITQYFTTKNTSTKYAVGDDAAVISNKDETLVTTDLLIEGVHFDLSYMPLKHLGYKAVMVNLSDVYAMNGTATQITVSIAVSNRFTLEAIEELYAGIQLACDTYNVDLVGGDTTSSTKGILISVTAIGSAKEEDIVYRHGAKATDLIVVTGDLGAAYLGLQVLEREKQVFSVDPNNQPDLDSYTYLIERQLKPEARKDIAGFLKELEVKPTAMIDISDGLSSEIMHICSQSKVGCKIYEEKLPLDPQVISACEEFELDSTMVALSGGEDYELLFTVPIADFEKIKGNPNFSIIGHITEENQGLNLVTRAGQEIELKAQGWNAMKE
jgi:thiamine-monophosphate kinase